MVILFQKNSKNSAKSEHRARRIIVLASPNHWTKKACIKFLKWMFNECMDTNADPYIVSLQIKSTLLGQGLPSHATPLSKWPIRGNMLILHRWPINNSDDGYYETLVEEQSKWQELLYSQKL